MRKGSVQKMASLLSAMSEELTAMLSSIGSSGGMTDVTINTHEMNSLYL